MPRLWQQLNHSTGRSTIATFPPSTNASLEASGDTANKDTVPFCDGIGTEYNCWPDSLLKQTSFRSSIWESMSKNFDPPTTRNVSAQKRLPLLTGKTFPGDLFPKLNCFSTVPSCSITAKE